VGCSQAPASTEEVGEASTTEEVATLARIRGEWVLAKQWLSPVVEVTRGGGESAPVGCMQRGWQRMLRREGGVGEGGFSLR